MADKAERSSAYSIDFPSSKYNLINAPRRLMDGRVAKFVMDLENVRVDMDGDGVTPVLQYDKPGEYIYFSFTKDRASADVPHYSTEEAHVVPIIVAMRKKSWMIRLHTCVDGFIVNGIEIDGNGFCQLPSEDNELPRVVCQIALLCLEESKRRQEIAAASAATEKAIGTE